MKKLILVFLSLIVCINALVTSIYADEDPTVTSVVYNETTKEIVVTASEEYISSIGAFVLNGNGCPVNGTEWVALTETTATLKTNYAVVEDGEYDFVIEADGYNHYESKVTITGYGTLKDVPSFTASIDDDGDFIIVSSDDDFLDALVQNVDDWDKPDVVEGIVPSTAEGYYDYYFAIRNSSGEGGEDAIPEYHPLQRGDGKVVFRVADQLNYSADSSIFRGQILNDVEYDVNINAPGYKSANAGKIKFEKANARIPVNDIGVYIAPGYLIVSWKNDTGKAFVDAMYFGMIAVTDFASDDFDNMVSDYREAGDELTINDYDTIHNARVFEINTEGVDLTQKDWTALLYSKNYACYCWDGRPFGGVAEVEVKNFTVYLKDNIEGAGIDDDVEIIGIYELPAISPVNGKTVVGWKVETKDANILRCVGEKIFITADTKLYAIYEDAAEPEKVEMDVIIGAIVANAVTKINVDTNAFSASLENDSFIAPEEKTEGAAIWVETNQLEQNDEKTIQIRRALELNNEYDADQFVLAFDINVFKQIGLTADAVKITETDTAIEISLDLSGSPTAMNLAIAGKLGLYSIHDGSPQNIIRGIFDKRTNKYTVQIRKFSTFAFIEAVTDPTTVIDTTPNSSDSNASTASNRYRFPKTGVE